MSGVKVFGPFGIDLTKQQDHDDSVNAHYGMSDAEFNEEFKKVIGEVFGPTDTKTQPIDTIFKDLNEKQRAKIFMYGVAVTWLERVKRNG